jgi:DNA (cytosine-5)-methyltransferase 1
VNVLELFAGIGGLSLGLERAGMTCVGQVEINPFCRQVLAKHWPDVPRHGDVRTALAWWTSEPRPEVDVVAGGYPCQPESTAGRRRGTDDERWLWPEMARIVHALRPRWVIGENVSGHRTQGLRFVLRDLDRLGYTATAGTIRACDLGAPHQRERIFVLAYSASDRRKESRTTGTEQPEAGRPQPDRSREMANTDSEGRQPGSGLGPAGSPPFGTGWWAAEPDVGRVANGVPGRVDRLRGLGNAVVPQVGEHIGHIVVKADRGFADVTPVR